MIFVFLHWTYFSDWLNTVQHAEFFGQKINRQVATETAKKLAGDPARAGLGSFAAASDTIQQAILAPALKGAEFSSVNLNPDNNRLNVNY